MSPVNQSASTLFDQCRWGSWCWQRTKLMRLGCLMRCTEMTLVWHVWLGPARALERSERVRRRTWPVRLETSSRHLQFLKVFERCKRRKGLNMFENWVLIWELSCCHFLPSRCWSNLLQTFDPLLDPLQHHFPWQQGFHSAEAPSKKMELFHRMPPVPQRHTQDLEDPYGEAWREYGSNGRLIPSIDFQVLGWKWNEIDRNGWN